jgi:hypothetical protein
VHGDGGSGAVLLRFLDASEVDAHASTVNRLDLKQKEGKVSTKAVGRHVGLRCKMTGESACNVNGADLDSLGLISG